jgi:prepilin-type N-terminal cleavage/methylation domain-containing protein
MKKFFSRNCKFGFSLVELMISMAIMGTVATGTLQYFKNQQKASKSMGVVTSRFQLEQFVRNELQKRENLIRSAEWYLGEPYLGGGEVLPERNGELRDCLLGLGVATCKSGIETGFYYRFDKPIAGVPMNQIRPKYLSGPTVAKAKSYAVTDQINRADNCDPKFGKSPGCPIGIVTTFKPFCRQNEANCKKPESMNIHYKIFQFTDSSGEPYKINGLGSQKLATVEGYVSISLAEQGSFEEGKCPAGVPELSRDAQGMPVCSKDACLQGYFLQGTIIYNGKTVALCSVESANQNICPYGSILKGFDGNNRIICEAICPPGHMEVVRANGTVQCKRIDAVKCAPGEVVKKFDDKQDPICVTVSENQCYAVLPNQECNEGSYVKETNPFNCTYKCHQDMSKKGSTSTPYCEESCPAPAPGAPATRKCCWF